MGDPNAIESGKVLGNGNEILSNDTPPTVAPALFSQGE